MALIRGGPEWTITDDFDRVLDKGIVFDAWDRVSRAGIELSSKVHLVVSSIQTRLAHERPSRTTAYSGHDAGSSERGPRTAARRRSRPK
jgi:hypothetical protein